jgi:hypothetical protein
MPGSGPGVLRPVPDGSAQQTAGEQRPSGPDGHVPATLPALPRRTKQPGRPGIPHRPRPLNRPVLPEVLVRPGPPGPSAPPLAVRLPAAGPPPALPAPAPPEPGTSAPALATPGAPAPAQPAPGASAPPPPAPTPPAQAPDQPPPSWPSVLATTMRLWARRRLRVLWPARAGWRVAVVLALVGVIFAAGAVTVRLIAGRGQPGSSQPGAGQPGAGDSALAAAAAQRRQAAGWVASQVSPDAIVACDPVMCAALQARGMPAGRLLVLSARPDPLGSDVIVATQAVRSQFGARLAGVYAPVTLASFGTGPARIDIRVMAPDGAAVYRAQLAADVAARRADGAQLLQNRRIQLSAAARAALTAGRVDARLLVTLPALAALHPVDIISFGGASPGAGAGVPLRSADITGIALPGGHQSASLAAMTAFLRAQRSPYLPSSLEIVRISPQQTVLSVGYPLPSPLGLLGSRN